MNFLSNLHTHTTYSDGVSSAEEYVKLAIEKEFISLGFSDHAPLMYDGVEQTEYTMPAKLMDSYIQEITALKEKYEDQIEIYLGIEEDYSPVNPREKFDYIIGAVHNIINPVTRELHPIDKSKQDFAYSCEQMGGVKNYVQEYYHELTRVALEYKPDILAHFDLVTKFNENNDFFDTNNSWYQDAVMRSLEQISQVGCIFEINSGAISRGYRSEPYPGKDILKAMLEMQIPVTVSSDAHSVDGLDAGFELILKTLRDVGYKSVKRMQKGKFCEIEI